MPPSINYKCADGRDFPVEWPSPEAAKDAWFWDPEHNPAAVTPLDAAIWSQCSRGTGRARTEWGFDESDVFIGGPNIGYFNGFTYWHETATTSQVEAKRKAANDRLREQYACGADFWERECMPKAIAAVHELRGAKEARTAPDLIEAFGYGFEQTFLMFGIDNEPLRDFLKDEVGEDAERIAADLSRGYPSATLDADQAAWRLAQIARSPASLRSLLTSASLPSLESLRGASGGDQFAAALDAYLDQYGWRTIDWDPSSPMLRERPQAILQVVRRTITEDLPEPNALLAAAAAGRDELAKDIEGKLGGDAAKLVEFRKRLHTLSRYIALREGRALWQLSLCGAVRHAFLSRGQRLVAAGYVDAAEDVFYLLPEEIDGGLGGAASGGDGASELGAALRELVGARRAERERWAGAVPPAKIGGEAEAQTEPETVTEVRGTGASRGTITARARILASFEEYERLGAGEVLVCVTTSPAWTPLFAVAGAVVSDGGGLLSHTAIAAREYGIPAVVGARRATQLIHDGAMVTVDGAAGVVTIAQ